MDAIVLAGGYATRLWPITQHRPKMLLPVGPSTVIDRIFQELEQEPRINNVYVSTNELFASDFTDHLENTSFSKPKLTVEETTAEEEKFGVIGALGQLLDREQIKDDLLVIAGDNLISFSISDFLDFFESKQNVCLAAYDVGNKELAKSYGVVKVEQEQVVGFQEKPSDPQSSLVSIACYAFPVKTLSLFHSYLSDGNNPDEPGWFLQWLYPNYSVYAFSFDGAWFDIGTPESYIGAVAWALEDGTLIDSEAILSGTTLGKNVHVMSGAKITDSHLENSVVFPNAVVDSCHLKNSIIDEATKIRNIDLSGALIGAHTQIG